MSKKKFPTNTKKNLKKNLARLMAIQIFYQYDFFNRERKLEQIKEELIENYTLNFEENPVSYREKIDESFLNNLLAGLELDVEKIDAEISQFLKEGWSLEKIDDVARQILRLSVFELKFLSDIPAKVVIDEYVDIAASFFDLKRLAFFNAVVENLAKKFRADEF